MKDKESPAVRGRLSGPGLRTFLAVADRWELTEAQRLAILGNPAPTTFQAWAKKARENGPLTLDVDTLFRVGVVLSIHQALGILHAKEADGLAWLTMPHQSSTFGGRTPMDLMTSGSPDDLETVVRFLQAAQTGLYMAPVEMIDRHFTPYRDSNIQEDGGASHDPA